MNHDVQEKLLAIPRAEVRRPTLPIATALQEASDLLTICSHPNITAALRGVGIPEGFLEDLEARIRAARKAQSAWTARRDRVKSEELAEVEERAKEIRRELLTAARWNLRRSRKAQAVLDAIRGGSGVDDLVQDLFDLAVLLEDHLSVFEADTSFDAEAYVSEARELGHALSSTVSGARFGAQASEALELRDRAFTFMDDLVTELRSAGRYAFRFDPDAAKLFGSRHRQQNRLKQRRREESAAEDQVIEQAIEQANEQANEAAAERDAEWSRELTESARQASPANDARALAEPRRGEPEAA